MELPGLLSIKTTSAGNWDEGIRIHQNGVWATIMLCGNDNTGDSGTSPNSWSIHNNDGNFHIARNGSNTSSSAILSCVNNVWSVNGNSMIHSGNISSQSVIYANSAGSAPASDVYAWAKQSTKPSYALNEITGSSDIFKIVTYSYNSVSVASGSSATVTPSNTNIPSGYTAVAVYTVNSGGGRIYPRAHSADGTIVLVNESSKATVTPSMKVLCVKSTCVG